MQKDICLNFTNLPPEYRTWAQEAVHDFFATFPQYKDKDTNKNLFEIKEEAAAKDLTEQSFSQDKMEELCAGASEYSKCSTKGQRTPEELKAHFKKQTDGTYKFDMGSTHPADSQTLADRAYLWLQLHHSEEPRYSFPLEINFSTQNNSGSYGTGNMMSGVCIFINEVENTASNQKYSKEKKQAFFKMLLQHELGHAFRASNPRLKSSSRPLNYDDEGLPHCPDADCLMQKGETLLNAFEKAYQEGKTDNPIPFCQNCQEEIRHFMKEIESPQAQVDNEIDGAERDYEESPDIGPQLVQDIKQFCAKMHIPYRALSENQTEYPFSYNLYGKGADPQTSQPTGKMKVHNDTHVSLDSTDLNHFVAVMRGLKENGMTTVNLTLNRGSEEEKKHFAANAMIAATLVGLEISEPPYQLSDLRNYGATGMIDKIIGIQEQMQKVRDASKKYQENTDTSKENDLKTSLEGSVETIYNDYQQVTREYLPDKDHLTIFDCGVQAVTRAKSRTVIQDILAAKRSHTS